MAVDRSVEWMLLLMMMMMWMMMMMRRCGRDMCIADVLRCDAGDTFDVMWR